MASPVYWVSCLGNRRLLPKCSGQGCSSPLPKRVLRAFHAAAMDCQPLFHLCPGAETADVLSTVSHAATLMGAEGANGPASQVEMFQEREHSHGHGTPVVGEAKINGIVLFQAVWIFREFGAGAAPLILLGPVDAELIFT